MCTVRRWAVRRLMHGGAHAADSDYFSLFKASTGIKPPFTPVL